MILKEIPGTQGFLASSSGRIFSPDGKERNYYQNGDGYKTASVLDNDGRWTTFGVHRLVALAFILPPSDPTYLTVNHRDLNLSNNEATNLEWVPCKLNNIHAAIMGEQGSRPRILAKDPDQMQLFLSGVEEAIELIGCEDLDVWDAIRSGKEINGWLLKHHGAKDPIPNDLKKKTIVLRDNGGRQPVRPVKLKDIFTGEIRFYDSMNDAARAFGKSASHIHQCITREGKPKAFLKQYLVAYGEDEFRHLTDDEIIDIADRGAKPVVAYNRAKDVFIVCDSARSFIDLAMLSKKAVTTRLLKDGKVGKISTLGEWSFSYSSSDANKRIKALRERPGS